MPRETRRALLARSTVAAAGAALPLVATAAASPVHPDAELLRLGRELEAAWAGERAAFAAIKGLYSDEADALAEAAADASAGIVGRIERLPAATLDGLRVKALAVSWCLSGEPVDLRDGQDTTDLRLANSIFRDLLAGRAPA